MFRAKYRRAVLDEQVDAELPEVGLEIEKRYEIEFLEIGVDRDHVHFLVQSVPADSVTKLVTTIESWTARERFKRCPHVKKQLWRGEFGRDGYFASTVGKHGDEGMIAKYFQGQGQGQEYRKLYRDDRLALF